MSVLDLQGLETTRPKHGPNSHGSKGCGAVINTGGEKNSGLSVLCKGGLL